MKQQSDAQPTEELEQRFSSPYFRAGQEMLRHIGHQAFRRDEALVDIATAAETDAVLYSKPLDRVQDGGIAANANKITLGALEKARFFVRETTEQIQQGWNVVRKNPKKILQLGSISAVSVLAQPVVSAITEKVPLVRDFDKTSSASAEEPNQDNGGYPWANVEPGTYDSSNIEARTCASYVYWRLTKEGVLPERASAMDPVAAKAQYELVDAQPAAGSVGVLTNDKGSSHSFFVEAVEADGDTMLIADMNADGQGNFNRRYISKSSLAAYAPDLQFIHFEKPPVANGAFAGASQETRKRNILSIKNNLLESPKYLTSPNGRYNLLFGYDANLAVYDTQNNFAVLWQSGTKGRTSTNGDQRLTIEQNSKTGNYLLVMKRDMADPNDENAAPKFERVKQWNLGKANGITLNNDGTLSGIKNGKIVWRNAKGINTVPRLAKTAARKEAVAARKRTLAASRARSAKQNRAATKSKVANKKAPAVTKKHR